MWEEKNIEVEVEIEDRATIYADESLLELVWANLLSNAIKFTASKGKVTLNQTSTEEEVILTITDTGCGMSKQTIAHIFDKFYQGDTSRSMEGNGLGLALVRRIIVLHDGEIEVTSEVGKGTVFTIHLPINHEEERPGDCVQ